MILILEVLMLSPWYIDTAPVIFRQYFDIDAVLSQK